MLAILEDLLDSWPGTLLLVSHDRYLMERVTDHQFMVMDGKVDPRARRRRRVSAEARGTRAARGAGDRAAWSGGWRLCGGACGRVGCRFGQMSRSDEYRLRKQLSSVERKMDARQKRIDDLAGKMLQVPATDFVELGRLQRRVDEAKDALGPLELEWLELADAAGVRLRGDAGRLRFLRADAAAPADVRVWHCTKKGRRRGPVADCAPPPIPCGGRIDAEFAGIG